MIQYNKIIFTGPVGAGKTAAITSLSDVPPIKTDELATDMARKRKASTTVALDYGMMILSGGEKIHLYGTPGQERFDFMWDILITGGIGLVLLLDNTRPDPFQDLRFFLNKFNRFIETTGLVVGVTQMDIRATPVVSDYHRQFAGTGLNPPIFEVDARRKRDVSLLVQALLYAINPGLNDQ